ncbi:MAG: hydroxymethylglutaryl-CoA synthase [Candidatus Rokuibacteriota bacterium]|nr:MAG: hydroxymethylglutaryl-CoA synthase [Candidatus Rokubacteria bacterium]
MRGLVGYGVYVPYFRLDRKAIAAALGAPGGAGTRSVASYDEDTTSLGVEAARAALRAAPVAWPDALFFATSLPAYLDKTNATAIHAALGLDAETLACDMLGSVRSGAGALRAALQGGGLTLVVHADIRTGLPGGGDERDGGDGAAALLCADDSRELPVLAEPVAHASATAEFLERWRVPGEPASHQWEERFGEHAYVPLGEAAVTEALKHAGVTAPAIHHWIIAGPHTRAAKRLAASVGATKGTVTDDFAAVVGNTGTAHAALLLAQALDGAAADQLIAVVSLADGCDVTIWRTTAALPGRRPKARAGAITGGGPVSYQAFLTWRGFLQREPPRRPDPEPPAAPPSRRAEDWKFAFTGSRCQACGARHLPPQRVCVKCHAMDRMAPERLADVPATIATFTVDRLAYSLSPPVVAAVIDFEGGGRFQCELTDVDPKAVRIGDRVEMTFRRLFTAHGVHNYFWKARPVRPQV